MSFPTTLDLQDPLVLLVLGGGVVVLLIVILLLVAVRRSGAAANSFAPMLHQMDTLSQRVQGLSDGQHQLSGGLQHVSEAQATSQAKMLQLMEQTQLILVIRTEIN